jgi:uncharacterized membrane protein
VIAILGGLGAAIFFAASTTSSSRSARMIGAPAVVGWMMFVGLLATLPLFPLTGALDVHLTSLDVLLLVVTGLTNVFGLVVEYAALRVGRVGLVVGLVSSEGAVAAVINIVGGQSIGLAVALALAVIAGGVVVIGFASEDVDAPSKDPRVATMLALVAAGCFGVNLIAVGRLAADLPLPWALMAPRVAGVVCITTPLLLLGRLSRSRRAAPFVIVSGLSEVAGLAAFAIGSQTDLTVASVLTSQFATITAIAAWVIFRERLSTWQIVGVTAVIGGVAVLALLNV